MSKIDQIYRDFKILSKQRINHRDTLYHLIMGDDGSGYVEFVDYREKPDNPFHVTRSTVISFDSLSEGVIKMNEAINKTVVVGIDIADKDEKDRTVVTVADAMTGKVIFYSANPLQGVALTSIEIPEALNGLRR